MLQSVGQGHWVTQVQSHLQSTRLNALHFQQSMPFFLQDLMPSQCLVFSTGLNAFTMHCFFYRTYALTFLAINAFFFYRTLCLDIIHCSILTRVTSPDQVSRTNRWTRSSIRISLQQFCRSFIWSSTCGTQNTIISAQSCTCKGTLNSAQSYTWKSAQSYTFKPAHSFCFYCFSFMFFIGIY